MSDSWVMAYCLWAVRVMRRLANLFLRFCAPELELCFFFLITFVARPNGLIFVYTRKIRSINSPVPSKWRKQQIGITLSKKVNVKLRFMQHII